MITNAQREALFQFFGGYFHEDFLMEFDSPEGAVSAFVRQRGPGVDLRELGRAITMFIDEHPNDDELEGALFKELGCYYLPRADGISPRAWMLGIAARFGASNLAT